MIYNLYELADIYGITVRTLQRKLKDFLTTASDSQRHVATFQKDNRTALKNKNLTDFLVFCGLNPEAITSDSQRQSATPPSDSQRQKKTAPSDTQRHTATASDKEMIAFLKEQLKLKDEQMQKKDDQLESKDTLLQQQNSIIMATQKNMNDLLQQHNELKYTATKKEDLIKQLEYDRKKTESSVKAIVKLERTIDDALMEKRLRDGIEFSKQLMKNKRKNT
jgi:transposase